MAEELEQFGEVELEGDPDLVIASRDFEKIANSRTNVSLCMCQRLVCQAGFIESCVLEHFVLQMSR